MERSNKAAVYCLAAKSSTSAKLLYTRADDSFQISIRQPVLAAPPIVLPETAIQNTSAKLYAASIKEHRLLHQLINNSQQQLRAIAPDLMNFSAQLGNNY